MSTAQPIVPAAQPLVPELAQSDVPGVKTEPQRGYDASYGQDQALKQESGVKSEPEESHVFGDNIYGDDNGYNNGYNNNNNYNQQQNQDQQSYNSQAPPNDYGHTGTVGIKEDG